MIEKETIILVDFHTVNFIFSVIELDLGTRRETTIFFSIFPKL